MNIIRLVVIIACLIVTTACAESRGILATTELPTLPEAVANNAVATVTVGDTEYLVSFAGLSDAKSHADVHAKTWVFDNKSRVWQAAPPVPGKVGRLAAVAATAGERIFVFGGYSVAENGDEKSTPWVHSFDPATSTYTAHAHMPVPVDDAVAVTYMDRYIYLISGWHDSGNVNLVQVYDANEDTWAQATPTVGSAVFGHAGGIVENRIAYCDGVAVQAHLDKRRDYNAVRECYLGIIDTENVRNIEWRILPAHPGKPRYRMAAAGVPSLDGILFIGGSENPYNYNGIGYNGERSEPVHDALLYSLQKQRWLPLQTNAAGSMDHRGLVLFENAWLTVGGMRAGQQVTNGVVSYDVGTAQ